MHGKVACKVPLVVNWVEYNLARNLKLPLKEQIFECINTKTPSAQVQCRQENDTFDLLCYCLHDTWYSLHVNTKKMDTIV